MSPGRELAGRGVAAVGDADRAADAEAALGEVEPVADRRARCRRTGTQRMSDGVDAALQDEVLDQAADLVVGEARSRPPSAGRSTGAGRGPRCTRRRPPRPGSVRAVRIRPSPGSSRSMTSPSDDERRTGTRPAGRRRRLMPSRPLADVDAPPLRRSGGDLARSARRRAAPVATIQVPPTASDGRARRGSSARSAGRDPAGRHEPHLAEGRGQSADSVGRPPSCLGREELDHVEAGVERGHDLGRRRDAG